MFCYAVSTSSDGIAGNPCIPKGYKLSLNASHAKLLELHPAGNFSACRYEALALLKSKEGSNIFCYFGIDVLEFLSFKFDFLLT